MTQTQRDQAQMFTEIGNRLCGGEELCVGGASTNSQYQQGDALKGLSKNNLVGNCCGLSKTV